MKTDQTREIETALKSYRPSEMGGIKLNAFRGFSTAFEVPTPATGGIADCVRISEYFGDIERIRMCRIRSWGEQHRKQLLEYNCKQPDIPDDAPQYCEYNECRYNILGEQGTEKILITCFEIKISVADFKSKNGHNFVGNLNYYVVPTEIYKQVRILVPQGIGIISYGNWALRRRDDSDYKDMSDEDQKWMILSVLKSIRRNRGEVEHESKEQSEFDFEENEVKNNEQTAAEKV